MPAPLRVLATINPVSHAVDLMRHALGQPTEFGVTLSIVVLVATIVVAFTLATVLFDPEQRLTATGRPARA